jgi:hypothetical protein
MSLSELTEAIRTETDRLIDSGDAAQVPAEQLRTLVSAAVRLYAAATEGAAQDVPPIDGAVATTDAVVMACALLKAQDLNPFDLALWFSRSRVAG